MKAGCNELPLRLKIHHHLINFPHQQYADLYLSVCFVRVKLLRVTFCNGALMNSAFWGLPT